MHRVRKEVAEYVIFQIETQRIASVQPTIVCRTIDGAKRRRCFKHKTEQTGEYGADRPGRIPAVRMKIGYAQTQAGVRFEAAVRCDHINGGRFEWEFARKYKCAVIVAAVVW